MNEQHVGIAAAADIERLAGADGDDTDLDPGQLLELRQYPAEQAGLLGQRGQRDDQGFLGMDRAGQQAEDKHQ